MMITGQSTICHAASFARIGIAPRSHQ